VNAYGPIYGADFSQDRLEYLVPAEFRKGNMPAPMTRPEDTPRLRPWSWPQNEAPSPYWCDEAVWHDIKTASEPKMDGKGRVWYHATTRADVPEFCRAGADNPYAKNFAFKNGVEGRGLVVYDPKTGQQTAIDTCGGICGR
jgi:hypothetical protein